MPEDEDLRERRSVLELIQSALKIHPEAGALTVDDVQVDSFDNIGFSANEVRRATVSWRTPDTDLPTTLITKKWQPESWTSQFTGASESREARACADGILASESMPGDFRTPILGSHITQTGQWIVMEDVTSELERFRSSDNTLEKARTLLDSLASFHARWEKSGQLPNPGDHLWLLSQESRLRLFSDWWALALGRMAVADISHDGMRAYFAANPEGVSRAPATMEEFFTHVPDEDIPLWEHHLHLREDLVAAGANLAQTLLHGDLHLNNIGLRESGGAPEILTIDWEWMGTGSHAIDVMYYLNTSVRDPEIDLEELKSRYLNAYRSSGGQAMDEVMWDRACDLGQAYYGLCFLPIHRKAVVREQGEEIGMEWYRGRIAETTRVLRRMLG